MPVTAIQKYFPVRIHVYSSAGYGQTEKLNPALIQSMCIGLSIVLATEFYELLYEILVGQEHFFKRLFIFQILCQWLL